jgi:zinc/manganese transport system substrate-binding protein/manganese/iron transport system substrate-binding protein
MENMTLRPLLRLSRITVALLVTLSLIACQQPAASSSPGAAAILNVVTTTTVFADIVHNVGGSRVAVASIIPAGVGPEDYEPKPDDAKKLADASLVVSNGVGLDNFLDRLMTSAGGTKPRLVLGDGIPVITVDGKPNPHFWLDPTLVSQYYLPKIATKLSELDPAGKATYEANAAAYGTQLDTLDAGLKAKVETIPPANRKLVTFHDAFPYFARHYGFELIGVIVANVGQEPTASELAALVQKVKAAGVKAVFSEVQFNPKLAQTLADEAGVTRVVTTLYNDTLGPPPADTYLGMMRWNMDQIVQALT